MEIKNEDIIPKSAFASDEAKEELNKILEIEIRKFNTIRAFGEDIYNGKITLEEADEDQSDLVDNINPIPHGLFFIVTFCRPFINEVVIKELLRILPIYITNGYYQQQLDNFQIIIFSSLKIILILVCKLYFSGL